MKNQIKVSVIIPARNEEKSIGACLDSILANDYPQNHLEILVIDGMSTDRTREIVRGYTRRYRFVRLVKNPRQIIPAAVNRGIQEARGEIIVRMDAHTTYASDYIRQAVQALETSGAAMVGGVQKPDGNSPRNLGHCRGEELTVRGGERLLPLWHRDLLGGRLRLSGHLVQVNLSEDRRIQRAMVDQ